MSFAVSKIYKPSLALLTDFYQLTMAQGYWKLKVDKREAIFHSFFRKNVFNGGFAIACGLQNVIDFFENFKFKTEDLDYLASLKDEQKNPFFEEGFLNYLSNLSFCCDIDAVTEGEVIFPYEPLFRVQGPLLQCQLIETPLLNLFNFSTLIATKAARIVLAACGDQVMEFGLRRAQGIDGALTAARAAYIGGCHATSNVLAAKLFDIPPMGTHSHSWVMSFDHELDSFEAFAKVMPKHTVLLVDTYHTIEGVKHAIKVGKELKEKGYSLLGIRLDSGDLNYLSKEARKLLDQAGLKEVKIVASNELDEYLIRELKGQGAKIDIWGVGTRLVTAIDQAALDGVYKISAIKDERGNWKNKIKLSEQMLKVNNPGKQQTRRFYHKGQAVADMVYNEFQSEKLEHIVDPFDPTRRKKVNAKWEYKDLLVPIFRNGKSVYLLPTIEQIRQKREENLSMFHEGIKRFVNPHQYPVGMERSFYQLKVQMIEEIRKKINLSDYPK